MYYMEMEAILLEMKETELPPFILSTNVAIYLHKQLSDSACCSPEVMEHNECKQFFLVCSVHS